MKKIDFFCVILAFLIALGIVFLLSYKPMMNTNDTIKIGMVDLENKNPNTSGLKGLKNIDSNKINKETKEVNKENNKKEEIKKDKIEKKVEEKVIEKKEIVKEKKVETEKVIKKEIEKKKEVKEEKPKKVKPSLADLKKAISSSKPKLNSSKNSENKKESFNPEKESDEDLDRILGEVKNGEGLVSGNKMGTIGGKILVKWNSNNKKPVFPETAEYSGKNGTVKIKLKVDNYGNIISYNIEKGSGVPEIDAAIEKVVGSWKINLLKTKKQIGGTFYMNYSFNLK